MKKFGRESGFTLIELLIVVTILATLMTIMFRLGTTSADESKRIKTITRLQKLENCLSGYYAAFGSYPPVKVYGSRNIYTETKNGVQTENSNNRLVWSQIDAACRSQPLEACFPFADNEAGRKLGETYSSYYEEIGSNWSDDARRRFCSGFTTDFYSMVNSSGYWDTDSWEKVQIFKFGLLSYLLPRYLVMMKGKKEFYGAGGANACAQWRNNNDQCFNAVTGRAMNWNEVYESVERDENNTDESNSYNLKNGMDQYVQVANIPSQAVCARWISNLEGICATGHCKNMDRVYGVSIKDESYDMFEADEDHAPAHLNIYSPGNAEGNYYILDTITVYDAWCRNFYYYTPNGAQSYTLWSAGPNGRTFPPWVDKTGLLDEKPYDQEKESKYTVADWIADDIIRMNH